MTMKELIAEIEEADAEIDRGEFLTSEELEKEMEQW
jgi:predicted transcriptional regulator